MKKKIVGILIFMLLIVSSFGITINVESDDINLDFLGIGENRMGDDGAGPYITFELSLRLKNPSVKCINGGIVPEERLDEIIAFQPDFILIIED